MRNAFKYLIGKPEMITGNTRRRWEDNIRMDLERNGMGSCGLDSFGSEQN
jgi:hypothetical protein